MPKPLRAPTPSEIELTVLDQSRRRCALCFYLKGDLAEKHGQIAHLDDNRANYAEDNLAFLCMEHHSVYDSTTSQHKNYTIHEARAARDGLYEAIAQGRHINGNPPPAAGRETDRKAHADLVQMMIETNTMRFLRDANFAGWSFAAHEVEGLERFLWDAKGAEGEFVDPEIEALRQIFISAAKDFLTSLSINTFPTKRTPSYRAVPSEWEDDQPDRFENAVKELHTGADRLCAAYDELVRVGKRKLAP